MIGKQLRRVKLWISAFRPKTLTASVVPIIAGTALLKALDEPVHWWISVFALAASLCIQIGTNLINDSADFKKGADTEKRIGPKRVTQSGDFSAKTVMVVGSIFFLIAILIGIPLVLRGGMPIVWIGVFSVLCGYAYTAGPFPLAYNGLGDLFVIIFFGVIAVSGLFYLHTLSWKIETIILGLQVGFHCTVLIAINNLRDIVGDRRAHKKTLPVRFGKKFARYEIALLCFLPFSLQFYWLGLGFIWAAILPFIALPLAVWLVISIFKTEPSTIYNKFLAIAAALHILFGLLLSVGFLL